MMFVSGIYLLLNFLTHFEKGQLLRFGISTALRISSIFVSSHGEVPKPLISTLSPFLSARAKQLSIKFTMAVASFPLSFSLLDKIEIRSDLFIGIFLKLFSRLKVAIFISSLIVIAEMCATDTQTASRTQYWKNTVIIPGNIKI